ncbi:MAG: zinc-binding dehydrogenase [Bacteroidota bacterium]|nr:zinc-binding dehydrogenase [Bacteroidota bacterium]
MKAAILYAPHDFRIENVSNGEIDEEECLIRVHACGVCHSEIHQWDQKIIDLNYPRHIGHEVSGEIIKTGKKVKGFNKGDRVAVWTDGKGYAEEVKARTERIFPIAEGIAYEQAMAEPIACSTNAVLRANPSLADTVALVGTGFMGLIILQELRLLGLKKIIAIDIRDEMLKLARALGADITINPQKEDTLAIIKDLTNNKGVDVAFEVGGVQPTLDLTAEICRMEGKLVIFGYHPGPRQIKDLGYWNWMAFNIINAHFRDIAVILNGARVGMELLNAGKIKMERLITNIYPIEKIEEAFKAAKDKPEGFVKSVVVME